MTFLLVAGCGTGKKLVESKDLPDAGNDQSTADADQEVCTPDCQGRECGTDGCNGDCGTCSAQSDTCSEDGLCQPTPCESTKDCPGDLLCNKDLGQCVLCVGSEDCPEGKSCGADRTCHQMYPCLSDLDCKDRGLVCDKTAEQCVDCLGYEDCPEDRYCADGFCLDDVCKSGPSKCQNDLVLNCADDGSGWETDQNCQPDGYCLQGGCQALALPLTHM